MHPHSQRTICTQAAQLHTDSRDQINIPAYSAHKPEETACNFFSNGICVFALEHEVAFTDTVNQFRIILFST